MQITIHIYMCIIYVYDSHLQVALAVWPLVATINFSLIPERNRVPFISVCSLCWTCFLAYMKHLEHHEVDQVL